MKIALIADLHGNMTAVRALEEDLKRRNPDAVWCLGDLVGKGPSSLETYEWAMARCEVVLGGNWDLGIGKRLYPRDAYYFRQLGPKRLQALANLPLEHHVTVSGRKIKLIHGRPLMHKLTYIQDSKDTLLTFLEPDFNLLIYADCHRQGLRTLTGQIINIGSVGNSMGVPMVQYVILEGEPGYAPAALDTTFITLPYDNRAAAREAEKQPMLPGRDAYISEVLTGVYAGDIRKRTDTTL